MFRKWLMAALSVIAAAVLLVTGAINASAGDSQWRRQGGFVQSRTAYGDRYGGFEHRGRDFSQYRGFQRRHFRNDDFGIRHRRQFRPYYDYRSPAFIYDFTIPIHRSYEPRSYRANTRLVRAAHYDWCFSRYVSYRVADNTFKPHHRPRRQCISPYY